jgi:hypothetical protein
MAEEKKESWLNWMSLATVILAVCATLSTFKGGGYSTQSVISQAMASDQWAFYQAKKTKMHLYELQVDQMRLQVMTLPAKGEAAAAYLAKIADYEKQIAKYQTEQNEISAKAQGLEKQRDDAKRHGRPFGYAVIFLQVAILLNSIAGLLKMKRVWWVAIPVGLVGVLFFADGFLMFL